MRIVHCNVSDSGGGAAIAARRLHLGLCKAGCDSLLAVGEKYTDIASVVNIRSRLQKVLHPFVRQRERLPLFFYQQRLRGVLFSPSWFPSSAHKAINKLQCDIIHLHWIADSFLPMYSLRKLNAPVVWTLHDTWAMTGGCHILQGCTKFQSTCGHCPQLGSTKCKDLSTLCYALRHHVYSKIQPTIVVPSTRMGELAAASSLLQNMRIAHIPNGVDTKLFCPREKRMARDVLSLPQDALLVLFGAVGGQHDPNKGFDLLCEALRETARQATLPIQCMVFGASHGDTSHIPYPVHFLGKIQDELLLALIYSAADVFVCPSREENLPNTILEALSCGTPSVGFAIGGIPDLISHGHNGFLAEPYATADLAQGIITILSDPQRLQDMGDAARDSVLRKFSIESTVSQYTSLYADILA